MPLFNAIKDLSSIQVMGILNSTPDSFSDGGRFVHLSDALRQVESMLTAGAGIIDIGGESTRPGAEAVGVQQELDRVIPVIEAVAQRFEVPISIDTSKPAVMRAAVAAGAGLINDVMALQLPGAVEAAVQLGVPVCLMHMQGEPRTMQSDPTYIDVVGEVIDFLHQRAAACRAAGMARQQIIVDPGFGFGKRLDHNLTLLQQLPRIHSLGYPLLVGMSRKSMIGQILGHNVAERLSGSLALATMAAWLGANIIRVHDVQQTVDVVKVVMALKQNQQYGGNY